MDRRESIIRWGQRERWGSLKNRTEQQKRAMEGSVEEFNLGRDLTEILLTETWKVKYKKANLIWNKLSGGPCNHLGEKDDSSVSGKSGSDSKESVCDVGDQGSTPGSGRLSGEGNGNPLQYCCLENPMDRGAWRALWVHRVSKSRTQPEWLTH